MHVRPFLGPPFPKWRRLWREKKAHRFFQTSRFVESTESGQVIPRRLCETNKQKCMYRSVYIGTDLYIYAHLERCASVVATREELRSHCEARESSERQTE